MTAITVPLTEDRLARLRELAAQAGVSPEEMARAGLEQWLAGPSEEFRRAAQHVLRKNADLYRRLA
jgi:antitoxin FitA